ncbi:MAG: molybdopterin molybdotransferase MoeA [Candidatus Delongbacteria bacterium]|nr:molybdopterin molybdotransferase MoeA [Candidatus Delongbacteria bacterium]
MIDLKTAWELILENSNTLNTLSVKVTDSVGYILDEDIYSPTDMPPFDKSAMDGYAFKHDGNETHEKEFFNIGMVAAGDIFTGELKNNECISIMTGAPLPDSTDTVIAVENTYKEDGKIVFDKNLKSGANVCFQGEDIAKGQLVLIKGTRIKTSHIAVISACGYNKIKVISKPRIAILNTGSEIIEPGDQLRTGQIYNSNGQMLQAMCKALNLPVEYIGIAKDNEDSLSRSLIEGLKYDILLISGGVSMGKFDLVPDMLQKAGVEKIFHKVKIKPGKPLFFGKHSKGIVFGLPGNPLSNFVGFTLFVTTAVKKMMNYDPVLPVFETGFMTEEFKQRPGRKNFFPAVINEDDDQFFITPVKSNGSADILSLAKANGFLIADEEISVINVGEETQFLRF